MCVPSRVDRSIACLAWAVFAGAASGGAAEPVAPAAAPEQASPLTIVDLQPFRTETVIAVQAADGVAGTATLTNLNPNANAWFLLNFDWGAGRPAEQYHLQNARPERLLSLQPGARGQFLVTFSDSGPACILRLGAAREPSAFESARLTELPFAPVCDGRLYVRNPTVGRASALERVTGFLRDHVWGGEEIVTLVKKELYRDVFVEQGRPEAMPAATAAPEFAPAAALLDPAKIELAVEPPHLGLDVDSPTPRLLLGRWYALRGLPDTYFSALMPEAIAPQILFGHDASVNPLDRTESTALVYLVAFDLARFNLHFTLGTDHPRLGWSPRPPPESRDPLLPGPDGIDSPAPLVIAGMVPPTDAPQTVAAFAGGFKREHGAFRFGTLAERNHGSHYGFVEQGVVFSRLQPGLATVYTNDTGEVHMESWTAADALRMAGIRDARQNGVPLIEYDAHRKTGVPGGMVNLWGEGNWSGSANEDLRTVRAGLCIQESGVRRFLIFAYFSAASPSAMARAFQAYSCRYAMHLDMNALEHTYFALYVSRDGQRTVEHLIDGMDVLDRHSHDKLAPRFVGFPDNRDFFYVTRRTE